MARVKNAGGGPCDEDLRQPPHLPADVKSKATKKTTSKKRKYADVDTARAAAVAAAIERAERGGAKSEVQIAYQLSPAHRSAIEQVERRYGSLAGTVMLEQ